MVKAVGGGGKRWRGKEGASMAINVMGWRGGGGEIKFVKKFKTEKADFSKTWEKKFLGMSFRGQKADTFCSIRASMNANTV